MRRRVSTLWTQCCKRHARASSRGGRVFGYDNLRIAKGHVERRVNDTDAMIVRRVYEMAAFGHGSRHIAHVLNEQGVPTPPAQRGRPSGWGQGTIRAVLERALYRGVVEYGKTRKRGSWGARRSRRDPKAI